jgi:formylglycine-generating enzyme required for sulfatase activity
VPNKLCWQSKAGETYDLWRSDDLAFWSHVEGYPKAGTGGMMEHPFTPGVRGFFRIVSEASVPEGFALIPGGEFLMGDQSNPPVGYSSELPVHTVQVSAFYMGKYEVTKELWDEVRAWGLNNGYTDLPTGGGKATNHPVQKVSWYDVVKWCNARSQQEGLTPCYTVSGATYKTGSSAPVCNWAANGYRLPTEAEWEKVARGGLSGQLFPWGNTITHSQANYYSSASYAYDMSPTRDYHPIWSNNDNGIYPYSSPVGSFAPNGYGLYDMAGTVCEWCWDWYSPYAAGSQTDPRGAASGSARVRRGGSWYDYADDCRAAVRGYNHPGGTRNTDGFRIARSSVP